MSQSQYYYPVLIITWWEVTWSLSANRHKQSHGQTLHSSWSCYQLFLAVLSEFQTTQWLWLLHRKPAEISLPESPCRTSRRQQTTVCPCDPTTLLITQSGRQLLEANDQHWLTAGDGCTATSCAKLAVCHITCGASLPSGAAAVVFIFGFAVAVNWIWSPDLKCCSTQSVSSLWVQWN